MDWATNLADHHVPVDNDEKMKLEEVEEWVTQKMDEQEIKRSNYSLYYSMDFCDLVLFTKETPLKQLLNAAWEITYTTGERSDIFAMPSQCMHTLER